MNLVEVLSKPNAFKKYCLGCVPLRFTKNHSSIKPLGFKIVSHSLVTAFKERVLKINCLVAFNTDSVSNLFEDIEPFDRMLVHDVKLVDEWVLGLLPSLQLAFRIFI